MMTTKIVKVATIQIALPETVGSDAEAADFISETMRDAGFLDWQYLMVGGQFLYATDRQVSFPYQEGTAW